jgi:hypothetical protein
MPPQTIDEVLTELDQIILHARNERSRLGFFSTLYRNVTILRNCKKSPRCYACRHPALRVSGSCGEQILENELRLEPESSSSFSS